MPVSIVLDKEPRFTLTFCTSLRKSMNTKLNLTIAFHTQTVVKFESTIQILEYMLRARVLDFKGSWDNHLLLVDFSYNNNYQSSIEIVLTRHFMEENRDL